MTRDELSALMPNPTAVDWEALEAPDGEEIFTKTAFLLLKECGVVSAVISGIYTQGMQRNDAINAGLAVRITKLVKVIVRDLSNREQFQQESVARQILETSATLVYLLNDEGSGSSYDAYINDSLVAEKMVLEDITRIIRERGGDAWTIEKRMKSSIENTANAAGIGDLSSLPGRAVNGFPRIEDRLKMLGENVYIAYRMTSSEVHGTWTDLYKNHLVYSDGLFEPDHSEHRIRPQVATSTTSVVARVFGAYVDRLNIPVVDEIVDPILDELILRNQRLVDLHEAFLASAGSN